MITVGVKVSGLSELQAYLQGMSRQIPYATSVALNEVAKKVQDAEVDQIKRVFTVRSSWYSYRQKTGVKIQFAKKTALFARVYSDAEFLSRHEEGTTKRPRRSFLAVPTENVKRTSKGAVAASNKPRAKGTFIINSRKGPIIAQRTTKGRGKARTSNFVVLFGLEKQARIKPVLRYYDTARRVVSREWAREFDKAFDRAIRTAR